ncbi:MAG: AzlD domain-containing protein [Actinomycetota bacterium]|nr:AzlD domain-containing protein [Actinomycetota bacterium]
MADAWLLVFLLIVTTAVIRASGPVLLGARRLPDRARSVIALMAPALLAALVVTETFRGDGSELTLDARALGVAGAGVALTVTDSLLVAMGVAVALTASARAIF